MSDEFVISTSNNSLQKLLPRNLTLVPHYQIQSVWTKVGAVIF